MLPPKKKQQQLFLVGANFFLHKYFARGWVKIHISGGNTALEGPGSFPSIGGEVKYISLADQLLLDYKAVESGFG